MIIEVLDNVGGVIAKVTNVGNPDEEVVEHGGDTWRDYVEPDEVRVERLRQQKLSAVKSEGLARIGAIIPALCNLDMVDLMIEMLQASMVSAPSAGSDMDRVKEIYVYAKGKVVQAQTATEDQLNQYDPATDSGWPT